MRTAVVTGSLGLVGSAVVRAFAARGVAVVGLDDDMRRVFFGREASNAWQREALSADLGAAYRHVAADIRDGAAVEALFAGLDRPPDAVVHCAAQPSHDWAATAPLVDFAVNATGTLTLLEATRQAAPEAVFVHMSTNKVYGDRPNDLPLVEAGTRLEIAEGHPFRDHGIDETLSVDACLHSVFGASKLAADVMAQEYGRYFGMRTVILRGGCISGPAHAGAEAHGFLSYLAKCAATGTPYRVIGHGGLQVRDSLHADDLAAAIVRLAEAPPAPGSVFNVGGGRANSVSVNEAIALAEAITGRAMRVERGLPARAGDHRWYVSDCRRLAGALPGWAPRVGVGETLDENIRAMRERWS